MDDVAVFKECSVCLSSLDSSYFTKLECRHEFCTACVIQQFKECLSYVSLSFLPSDSSRSNRFDVIPCLEKDCGKQISKKKLREILPEVDYIKYHQMIEKKKNNLSDCPKCGKLLPRATADVTEVTCPCGHQFCFFHSNAHPISMSCQDYEKKLLENDDIQLSLKKMEEIKNCPGCENPVEKSSGCDHIKCAWCGTKFCYNCRGTDWGGSSAAPVCRGCGQEYLDHDHFWKWQLLSILLIPIWVPVGILWWFFGTCCCLVCCWPCKLSNLPSYQQKNCCATLRSPLICQFMPEIICCVFWGCGPWHDIDEPPNEINEILNAMGKSMKFKKKSKEK